MTLENKVRHKRTLSETQYVTKEQEHKFVKIA